MEFIFELLYELLISPFEFWYMEFRCRIEAIPNRALKLLLKMVLVLCAVLIPLLLAALLVLLVLLIFRWIKK